MIADDVAATGVTYRQFDHWLRRGYVPGAAAQCRPGTGYHRNLTDEQLDHIRVMGRLVKTGLAPEVATQLAAQIREQGQARLGDYILTPATGDAA